MIENYMNLRYNAWYAYWSPFKKENNEEDVEPIVQEENVDRDLEEWKIVSRIVSPNNVDILDLQNIDRRDFYTHYNWQGKFLSYEIIEH